jgi:hypothetical protein
MRIIPEKGGISEMMRKGRIAAFAVVVNADCTVRIEYSDWYETVSIPYPACLS